MATALYFDISVHYDEKVNKLTNVDSDRYCSLDLLDDVTQRTLSHLTGDRGCRHTILRICCE